MQRTEYDAVIIGTGRKHATIPKAAKEYFVGPTIESNIALAERLAPATLRFYLSAAHGLLRSEETAWHALPTSSVTRQWSRDVEAKLRESLKVKAPRILALCTEGLLDWAPGIRASGGTVYTPIADLSSGQHRALARFAKTAPVQIDEFRKFAARVARGQV